jgi:hypothetical protein
VKDGIDFLGCVLNRRAVTQVPGRDVAQGAGSAAWLFHASERQRSDAPGPALALRVVAKFARFGVAQLANGTTIGFTSRLVSGAFGNNVIRPLTENTP